MSGLFGVVSRGDCVKDAFYGADYHSHLGTEFGGMAVWDGRPKAEIHKLSEHSFKSRFSGFAKEMKGERAIGVISDYEPQPLIINSRLGDYAIAHIGKVSNLQKLVERAYERGGHFSEMSGGFVNPIELVASLINQGKNIGDGIEIMQNSIEGSSSLILLTREGIYAARDKLGRTPLAIGKGDNAMAVAMETCAFPTLGFSFERFLGPGEIGFLHHRGYEQLKKPNEKMQICTFLWIYYGFPASSFEGVNVEVARNRCGEKLALRDKERGLEADFATGIPDSGTAHGLGFAVGMNIPYLRPFVKYTQGYGRSFMPSDQKIRELIAKLKIIPIQEIIEGKKIVVSEDSIVRATQLNDKIEILFGYGAEEVHIRPACPPLVYPCQFLNFSRSRAADDLAAVRAIKEIKGISEQTRVNLPYPFDAEPFTNSDSKEYGEMVDRIRRKIGRGHCEKTTLRYQRLDDMIGAIGVPKEKLCLGCWA